MLERIRDALLRSLLYYRSRPGSIRRHLAKRDFSPGDNCKVIDLGRVRVAAVQARLTLLSDPRDYAEAMYHYVREAAREGAQLVVFPEENGTHLLGMLPGIEDMVRDRPIEEALGELGDVNLADLFAFIGEAARRVHIATFSTLARGFGLYIIGGSINLPERDGRVYNETFLFGPGGEILGNQRKVHLLPVERQWGLCAGDRLEVYRTPLGNLAAPVCMDGTYFETYRILVSMGADIIAMPYALMEKYNYWTALRGAWPRTQESYAYSVYTTLVGKVGTIEFEGRSAIFAPLEMTPRGDGVLAETADHLSEGVIVADLDITALRERRRTALRPDPALCSRYLPAAYEEYARRPRL